MSRILVPVAALVALGLTGCATNGQYQTTTQDAAIGGAVGAVAGAVLGGDGSRTEGALIGGALGAAAGALYGCTRDQVCPWSDKNTNQSGLIYDRQARRSYYVYRPTGDTYWQDGQFRSAGGS